MTSLLQTWEGGLGNVFTFCLVVATLRLELNSSASHDTGGQHVAVKLLLGAEMFHSISTQRGLVGMILYLKPRTLKASSVYSNSSLSSIESTFVLP